MFNKIAENKILKKLPLQKMIYPAITLIFAIIVLVLFIKAILFLSGNINKAFSNVEGSLDKEVLGFDRENYELIRKRFSWPELQEATSTPETAATSTVITDAVEASSTKALISIKVLNSTAISGLANKLKTGLVQAGYLAIKVGNISSVISTTTVQIKPTKKPNQKFIDEITQIISRQYAPQAGADLPDSADYDILITIGKN